MRDNPESNKGLYENILASIIFYSPNFLRYVVSLPEWFYLGYNFIIIWMLTSTMSQYRFNKRYGDIDKITHKPKKNST